MNKVFFFLAFVLSLTAILIATFRISPVSRKDRDWALVLLSAGIVFILAVIMVSIFLGAGINDILFLSDKLAPRAPPILGFGIGLFLGSLFVLLKTINLNDRNGPRS